MNAIQLDSLGYQQLTSLSSAVGFTVPDGCVTINVQAESQNVRYRDDGTNPTSTVGMILYAGAIVPISAANFSSMKFIETAAGAKLNISCYGTRASS